MQPDEHVTPVIFKLDHGTQSPVAFFPQCPGTRDPFTMGCYAHHGQHSSASIEYVVSCKRATPEQYAPLLAELQRIGYRLKIRQRVTSHDVAIRRVELAR